MARLHSILHEQGRQIDELRLENTGQRKRIEALETCLEEEMVRRQGEASTDHQRIHCVSCQVRWSPYQSG